MPWPQGSDVELERTKPRQKPTVSVVEGDTAVRSSLRFSLEVEGFSVRDFPDGNGFISAGELSRTNCLVVDYNLPDMTGLEVLDALRDRRVAVPAILIANDPSRALRERAEAAGARVVEKPLLGDALMESIREVLAGH